MNFRTSKIIINIILKRLLVFISALSISSAIGRIIMPLIERISILSVARKSSHPIPNPVAHPTPTMRTYRSITQDRVTAR